MTKFKIEPHFRLQEWVAEEKGYFRDEGLDYEFKEFIRSTQGDHHVTRGQSGAFQSIEKGRESNITCACHWTVNVAASRGHTKLFADAYSVAPSGIFVHGDSAIRTPDELAGVAEWRPFSMAERRQRRCSAAPITSPSSLAIAKSSTPPS
jgi:hypothetical protein